MARILLIDDDTAGREMVAYNLRAAGHDVEERADGNQGVERYRPDHYDLVITDNRMPGISGIDLTRRIREFDDKALVLVITAFGDVDTAIAAIKAGAHDFLLKPFSRDQLEIAVGRALSHRKMEDENQALRRQVAGVEREIVYHSELMRETIALADRIACSDASVLVNGESGTGKELIARRIHARSTRADEPLITINCAAIPSELVEAELFGHDKGAFTGATRARSGRFRQADGGTLFLDEISELPLDTQGKLLRAVQEGVIDPVGADRPVRVDVRVIAASNRDLRAQISAGAFREDLYFRLNVVDVNVPPLRERRSDIPGLVDHFVTEFAAGREIDVPPEVMSALEHRRWPGNVRELRNACERMVVLCDAGAVSIDALPSDSGERTIERNRDEIDAWLDLPDGGFSLLDLERKVIERVLALKNGNISESARYLRVPRHILVYRIEKHGIPRPGK